MLTKVKILDCTLRDGGYYTDWDFSDDIVRSYYQTMNMIPVDYVEIGYRNKPSTTYFGKFYYCPQSVLENARQAMPEKKIAVMLNAKSTTPDDLNQLLHPCQELVDMVRLAVAPENVDDSLILAERIKDMGFNVGFNLMYLSKWRDIPGFVPGLKKISQSVSWLGLVDSYGGIHPGDVAKIIREVRDHTDVHLGFHGHNNMELALVNAITALDSGVEMIDTTISGMGRGAGNLKTELFLVYLSSIGLQNIDFNLLSEAVGNFEQLRKNHEWGPSFPYMISGAYSLPQKDVMDWLTLRLYSVDSIVRSLTNRKSNQKDNVKLPVFNQNKRQFKTAVIIGGGKNAAMHASAVHEFSNKYSDELCVIHASTKNAFAYQYLKVPQFFCLVGIEGRRFEKVLRDLSSVEGECILPPYPRKMGTYIPEHFENSSFELNEVSFTSKYQDSHFALALQTSLDLGAKNIYLVGFDGYKGDDIGDKEKKLIKENEYLISAFSEHLPLTSLTATEYHGLVATSIFSLLD